MPKHKLNKFWTIFLLVIVCASGTYLVYGLISGNWLLSMQLSNGFLTVRIKSTCGYAAGTSSGGSEIGLSDAGYFYFPGDNGVLWRGYAQLGNAQVVNTTWVGWQTIGNTSISVTDYYFTFDVLVYTVNTPFDIIPWSTATSTELQYYWHQSGLLGDTIRRQFGTITIDYLKVPETTNYKARLVSTLNLNAEFEMWFDPEKCGQNLPQSFDETTGTYSVTSFAVTDVGAMADPLVDSVGGYVTQPTVVFDTSTFGVAVENTNASNSGGISSSTCGTCSGNVPASDIEDAMHAVDGLNGAEHFTIGMTSFIKESSTGQYQSMLQTGMPISLDAEGNFSQHDYTDAKVTGNLPFLLQPKTTMWQTQYSYNYWDVASVDQWGDGTTTTAMPQTKNPAFFSLITTKNVYRIQRVQARLTIATNYTWSPYLTYDSPPIGGPGIDGTDGSLNPLPDNYISLAGGNIPAGAWDAFLAFFASWGTWIVIGVIAVVAAVIYFKFFRGGGSAGGGGSVTNVYYDRPRSKGGSR